MRGETGSRVARSYWEEEEAYAKGLEEHLPLHLGPLGLPARGGRTPPHCPSCAAPQQQGVHHVTSELITQMEFPKQVQLFTELCLLPHVDLEEKNTDQTVL